MNTISTACATPCTPLYRTTGNVALKEPAAPALRIVEGGLSTQGAGVSRRAPKAQQATEGTQGPGRVSPQAFRWLLGLSVLTSVLAGEVSLALASW